MPSDFALKHVCMWSEYGWKRVTPEEANLLHPGGTVHARGGLFRCELCGQNVLFTDGEVQVRHFRHVSSYADKDCPDRLHAYYEPKPYTSASRGLPLRIRLHSARDFELEIGFILPPSYVQPEILKNRKIKIAPMHLEYSLSRLQEGTITYLSAGRDPKPHYNISVDPPCRELSDLWPTNIAGFSENGTVFNSVTGKKLPDDADVMAGHTYYILTKKSPLTYGGVHLQACRQSLSGWTVYEAEALDFSEEAARFFWKYHCRLTENTATIVPLWPVYIKSPYLVFCSSRARTMSFFLRGNAELRVFPKVSNTHRGNAELRVFPKVSNTHHGNLYSVAIGGRQQLIAAGRMKMLRYMYVWKDDSILNRQTPLPKIDVYDAEGNNIQPGEYSELPQGKSLTLIPPFDGFVLTLKDGKIIRRSPLSSGTRTTIDAITYGCIIEAFQGLDLVWKAEFKRSVADDAEDAALLRSLEECRGEIISVPHVLGGLAARMQGCPLTQKWLAQRVREGRMYQRAYKILIKHFTR